MKVLIVDDNSENLYLLESILKGSGYITVSANNGAEALDLARKDIPDLIITDILMPVMDGFTLCREFKKDEKLCNVPFIFYTATYSDPRDEEFALRLGADRFILKPQDPEEFISIVKELLKEEKKKNIIKTKVSSIPEIVILKEYNQTLVRKLENKMLKLEQSEKEIKKNNILLHKEIEERKQAEEKLRESEEKYRSFFENSMDAIFLTTPDGKTLSANPEACRMFEYTEEELINLGKKGVADITDPNLDILLTERALNGKVKGELTMIRKDRTRFPVEISSAIFKNREGQELTNMIIRDISERKQAEEELLASIMFIEEIINSIPVRIFWKDKNLVYLGCNSAFARDAGFTDPKEIIGKDDYQMGWRDQAELYRYDDRNVIVSGTPKLLIEEPQTTPAGKTITLLTSKIPLRDSKGKIIGLLGTYMDITERKLAEEKLRESEERFRHSFDYAASGICIVGTEGKFQKINNTFREMIGYEEDEIKNFTFSDITHPDDLSIGLSQLKKMVDGEIDSTSFEKRYIRKDRGIIWVYLSVSLVRNVNHQPQFFITQILDITERKLAEEKIMLLSRFPSENPNPVLRVDRDGKINYANLASEELLRMWQCSELEYLPTDWRERVVNSVRHNTSTTVEVECQERFYSVLVVPIPDTEYVNLYGQDITERKLAEEKLQESEELFRTTAENLTDIIFDWDIKEDIDWYGDIDGITGYPPGGFPRTLEAWAVIVHPEDKDRVMAALEDHLKGVATYAIEYRIRRRDGEWRWWSARGTALRNDRGKPYKMIGSITDITEQKDIQNRIKFKSDLLSHVGQAVIATDLQGKVIYWNNAAEDIYGWSSVEAMGQNIVVLIPAEQTKEQANEIMKELSGGNSWSGEFLVKRKDGSIFPAYVTDSPIIDSNCKLTGIIGISNDITERKLSMNALRTSEAKFRSYVDYSPQGIFVVNAKGQYIDANESALNQIGCSKEYLLQKTIVDTLPKEELEKGLNHFNKLVKEGHSTSEIKLLKTNGEQIAVILDTVKISDDQFLGFSTDITERKLAEEALSNERSLLRTIIDLIPDAIYAVDIEGRKILANTKEIELSGKNSEDEIIGKTDFDLYPEIEAQRYYEQDQIIIQSGKPTLDMEDTLISKDGQIRWMLGSKVPLRDVHGQITGIVGVNHDITERKRSEEVLQQERDFSRTIIQTSPTFFVAIGSDGKTIMMNDSMLQTLGYNLGEVVGMDYLTNFVPVEDREKLSKIFEALVTTNKSTLNENSILTKDGRKIIVEWHGKNILKPKGELNYFFGIGIDITERKQNEKEIVILANALRSVDQCVSITDMEDKIIFINQSFLRTYGYREDEIIGKDMSVFRSQKNPPALVKEILSSTLSGGWNGELWNKRKDGSEFLISLSTRLIEDRDDKFFGLIGVASDITERKLVEKALNESEKKFRSVWEKSAEGMRITNQAGDVVMVNDAYCKLMGKPLDEIEGKLMSIVHEEERQVEILSKHEEQFHTRDIPTYLEKVITLWNGNSLFVEVLNTFLEIENQPTLLLSIFKDISDRKRTESELIAAKEKAEEMNRLKSNFLANMSHELRTPLVGILGFADILRQDVVSEETKAMADTIYKSGKRLSETLNLILDLSKFESEKLDIKHRKIDLVSKAEEIINSFEGAASKKGLTLKSSFSQSSIIINFEERAFHSILNNLINNALKFTSEGIVTTTIILNDDHVEIKVIDTGIGIAEHDYQNIFEEFRQASEGYNRNFEGSGLGLSITKKLVEKFGGTISVESEIEKGTTFTVILPVIDVETKEKEQTENVSKIIPEFPKPKSVKPIALLVDDDPFVFTVLKRYASEYIELETTVDADFAIKKLKKKKYDLIFMDINLRRGMDGKEATQIIRTMKGYESIPIIATTGYAMVGDKEEFLAAGCTHYLSKPFSKAEIAELLEKLLKLV